MNRRRAERKQDVNPVVIKLIHDGRAVEGLLTRLSLTENMSVCGLKIVTDAFIPVGSEFEVELSLIWSFKTIQVAGKVVWIDDLTDTFYEIGVEIIEASEENIRILTEHLVKI
jgi:Tfp pilus assembly protein PilZ